MLHVGGKNAKKKTSSSDSKRHFTVVMGNKEHGLYVSSSPSSAARKAVSKLCATDKKRKVQFSIREITQGSKKKTYGPYLGEIEKLKEPIELKGRVIKYKPVVLLKPKSSAKKGGMIGYELLYNMQQGIYNNQNNNGRKRITSSDMEIDKIYRILDKNSKEDLGLHKVMSKDDEHRIITISKYNSTSNSKPYGNRMNKTYDSIYGYLDTTGTWFHGKKKISLHEMEVNKIYELRPKHSTDYLDLYKVIEKDDEKDEIKLAKLKTHDSFDANNLRPKIMKLNISDNSIYGYEYELNQNRNTEVFNENEDN
jgi:hypothetical protein